MRNSQKLGFRLGIAACLGGFGLTTISIPTAHAEQFPSSQGTYADITLDDCYTALENGKVLLSVVRGETANTEIWYDGKLFTIAFDQNLVLTCFALKFD
jgi:hypothetical protein